MGGLGPRKLLELSIRLLAVTIGARFSLAQEVYSCGGFIKSAVPLEYGKLLVRLYTPEGNLKYETDCAPTNGYYMIPVYNKGSYVIRVLPPDGWVFEPESAEISVDGVNDPCSRGDDIDFRFMGFRVEGNVNYADSQTEGPTALALQLVRNKDQKVVHETKTDANGRYAFAAVLPGEYTVRGAASSACVKQKAGVGVSVSGGAAVSVAPLLVSGVAVSGRVLDADVPVAGVTFLLFGDAAVKLDGCKPAESAATVDKEDLPAGRLLCAVESATDGAFGFACVPPGQYSVLAVYRTGDVRFGVEPKSLAFRVDRQPVVMASVFEVKGFAASGRVLWSEKGRPMVGAKVRLNGESVATTDSTGSFALKQVTTAEYKIDVQFDDVEFTTVTTQLSPSRSKIADIVPQKFNLCGSVVFERIPASVPRLTRRKLLLTSGDDGSAAVSLTTDDAGRFCRMVARGRYRVTPQLLADEKANGVSLVPEFVDVDLLVGPRTDVSFRQFQARVTGQVQCLGPCKRIVVRLLSASGVEVASTELVKREPLQQFELSGVLPGQYTAEVSADHFCWESQRRAVDVGQQDVSGVAFRQTGFRVEAVASNAARLAWTFAGSKVVQGAEQLQRGSNTFCLPVDGQYTFRLTSCHQFQADTFKYNTDAPEPLKLLAMRHQVTGTIRVPAKDKDIAVQVAQGDSTGESVRVTAVVGDEGGAANKGAAYTFSYFAERNSRIRITPTSSRFLFTPEFAAVDVADDCVLDQVLFDGVQGLFLKGAVKPAIMAVTITVKKSADDEEAMTALTNGAGSYSIGPLRTFDGVSVDAQLDGYVFTPVEASLGHFQAFKLSELTITATDADGAPLSGVLISISGGVNYRSNNQSGDGGKITFIGLSPGDYFIRPILKEYQFEPPTKIVNVREGSTEALTLRGTRVAFSCLGRVRHAGGQPVVGAVVEAVSSACDQLHEEDATDDDGAFRVRGLQPHCLYRLRVLSAAAPNGAYPDFYDVQVAGEDARDRTFVLRPAATSVELAGRVAASADVLAALRVAVYRDEQPDAPQHAIALHQSPMFFVQNIPLDDASYFARLEWVGGGGAQYESLQLPTIPFRANSTLVYIEFDFRPQKKLQEVEISKSSYFALPLTLVIVFLAYNHAKVLPIGRQVFSQLMETASRLRTKGAFAQSDYNQADAADTSATRKRPRQRKT